MLLVDRGRDQYAAGGVAGYPEASTVARGV